MKDMSCFQCVKEILLQHVLLIDKAIMQIDCIKRKSSCQYCKINNSSCLFVNVLSLFKSNLIDSDFL